MNLLLRELGVGFELVKGSVIVFKLLDLENQASGSPLDQLLRGNFFNKLLASGFLVFVFEQVLGDSPLPLRAQVLHHGVDVDLFLFESHLQPSKEVLLPSHDKILQEYSVVIREWQKPGNPSLADGVDPFASQREQSLLIHGSLNCGAGEAVPVEGADLRRESFFSPRLSQLPRRVHRPALR